MSSRLLYAQLFILLPLAIVMWIAVGEDLFWRIWWLDIPMHFGGGLWAGLFAAWILARQGNDFSLLWGLGFALAIGIAWEFFDYSEGIAVAHYAGYWQDTVEDIVVDVLGAAVGWAIAKKIVGHVL